MRLAPVLFLPVLFACGDKDLSDSGAPSDSGTTDGGSTDGGTTDGGSTDGGSGDGGSSDGGSSDGGSSDGGTSDGGTSCDPLPEVKAANTLGSIVVEGSADLASLQALCADGPLVIDGDLEFQGNTVPAIEDLDCLVVIEDDLLIESGVGPERISLAGLQRIGGNLDLTGADRLTSLELPALAEIEGWFWWSDLPAMTSVDGLDALCHVGELKLELSTATSSVETFNNLLEVGNTWIRVEAVRTWDAFARLQVVDGLLSVKAVSQHATPTLFPTLPALTNVEGALTIHATGIEGDLSGLSTVTSTQGLTVVSDVLQDLSGLDSLVQIDGALSVYSNAALLSLDGLPFPSGITRVFVDSNPVLDDLSVLAGLFVNLESLAIFDNPSLVTLTGLESVEEVADDVVIGQNELVDLSGLSGLRVVGGLLWIQKEAGLLDLTGLGSLEAVHSMEILENDALVSLDGLVLPAHVTGELTVMENPLLSSVEGLAGLEELGIALEIRDNPSLASVSGLEDLVTVRGKFNLPGLSDLSALASLESVSTHVWLSGAADLSVLASLETVGGNFYADGVEISGLPALTSVGGDLALLGVERLSLPLLESVAGEIHYAGDVGLTEVSLPVLRQVGSLLLKSVPTLSAVDVGALEEVEEYLTLEGTTPAELDLSSVRTVGVNLNLRDLTAAETVDMSSLERVSGHVELTGNTVLTALSATALTEIGEDLRIDDNAALSELSGFSALETVGEDLSIQGNAQLTDAEAEDFAAGLSVGGSVEIADNGG